MTYWRGLSGDTLCVTIHPALNSLRTATRNELDVPRYLARRVHEFYFEPQHDEFRPRTLWSLSNAFTSAFKELDPIPQFKATAKLGGFLETRFKQSF